MILTVMKMAAAVAHSQFALTIHHTSSLVVAVLDHQPNTGIAAHVTLLSHTVKSQNQVLAFRAITAQAVVHQAMVAQRVQTTQVVLEVASIPMEATAVDSVALLSEASLTLMVVLAEAETAATRTIHAAVMAEVAVANSADLAVAVATLVVLLMEDGALGVRTAAVAVATTSVQTKTTFQVLKKAMA
jgi:hypothetical protein